MRKIIPKNKIISLLSLTLISFFAFAEPNTSLSKDKTEYFNEIYGAKGLRDIYAPLGAYLSSPESKADGEAFLVTSKKAFQNDNALDSVPRILTPAEAKEIQKGVEQRARALRAFLKDHYSGKKYYAKSGLIPENVVQSILARAGESTFDGLINPKTISFMYGPDIIRDASGKWRVIEDNPGFIGGLGDLKLAYDLIIQKHQDLLKSYDFADPKSFYHSVAVAYREKALQYGGKAILYMTPPYADNEDKRIEKLFAAEGIETVTPSSSSKLRVTEEGVFLISRVNKKTNREKVGYIFVNGEHAWLDNSHPATKVRNILESANEYLKDKKAKPNIAKKITQILTQNDPTTHLPNIAELERLLTKVDYLDHQKSYAAGLLDAMLKNKVGSNYSAGIDFIGDKEFYVYVEELIKHYLHEEPILRNIPTEKFIEEKTGQIKNDLITRVLSDKNNYVVKKVDGRGGDSVWVGSKSTQQEFENVLLEVKKNPSVYIVQQYMHLSVHGENIVDLRAISAVLPDRVIVAETPWGRALPLSGNGKVNLSDKGREITVLVIKKEKQLSSHLSCNRLFKL